MLRWIVGLSLQFRFLVLPVALAVVILAGTRFRSLHIDALPEFAPPIVEVQTEALGLSAVEVESSDHHQPRGADERRALGTQMSSQSVAGLSSIRLALDPGADIMRVRQMVQERLTLAYTLPNVSKPPVMLQPLSATNRVMMVGLSSKAVPLIADVRARLLDHQAEAARRAGRGQRRHLGRAHAAAAGARRSRAAQGARRQAGADRVDLGRCALGLLPELPQGLGTGLGRLDRRPQSAPRDPARAADLVGRGLGQG